MIAVVVAYSGIISIALPVTIIGKHFNDLYFRAREVDQEESALFARDQKATLTQRLSDSGPGKGKVPSPIPRTSVTPSRASLPPLPPSSHSGTVRTPITAPSPPPLRDLEEARAAKLEEMGGDPANMDDPTIGLRKRALTNLIRDQLRQMVITLTSQSVSQLVI